MSAILDEARAHGQYGGWPDWQAEADIQARGGHYSNEQTSSGGGSAPIDTRISAPDLAKLSLQAAGIIHPYYVELAKQANGNFDQAIKLMQGDYTAGVKKAKEDNALAVKYGQGDLQNALDTLGVSFNKENEKNIDTLNSRGAAVYQNNPDGTPNVVQGSTFNPSFDPNAYTFNQGVSGANPNQANLGRGGYEAEQLRKDQSLRAEATMRAGMKPLEAAGINLKQNTNVPAGFDVNKPLSYTGDFSQLGSLERGLQANRQTKEETLLNTKLAEKAAERTDIANTAKMYGDTATKSIDADATNALQKQYNASFIAGGINQP